MARHRMVMGGSLALPVLLVINGMDGPIQTMVRRAKVLDQVRTVVVIMVHLSPHRGSTVLQVRGMVVKDTGTGEE